MIKLSQDQLDEIKAIQTRLKVNKVIQGVIVGYSVYSGLVLDKGYITMVFGAIIALVFGHIAKPAMPDYISYDADKGIYYVKTDNDND